MKAIKLIWLADRLHLRKYARTITGDIYFALPFGPVASTTRDLLERYSSLSDTELEYVDEYLAPYGVYEYHSTKEYNLKVFSKSDIQVLEVIFENYGHLTQYQLTELSHTFPEWVRYKSALEAKLISRETMIITDFYKNNNDLTGLFVENEQVLSDSLEIYLERQSHFA